MSELSSQPTPIQAIYGWYRDGKLIVNRTYQRKLVWSLEEKQKLVDSVLRDYPIPLVLLGEKTIDGKSYFEIIDGLQRLHTLVSFIEQNFPALDGLYFDINQFVRAKFEADNGSFSPNSAEGLLGRQLVAKYLDYILPVSIMRGASYQDINDVFGRINSYGHQLSDQERRQAGLLNNFARFIRGIACDIRGDVSLETVELFRMPEISVDLPKTKYGYRVQARRGVLGISRYTPLHRPPG